MENNLIIFSGNNESDYTILGLVSLPDNPILNKEIIIYYDKKTYIIEIIYNDYIYSDSNKLKIALCKKIDFEEKYKNILREKGYFISTPSSGMGSVTMPLSKDEIIFDFLRTISNNNFKTIDIKPFFRKDKIEKILEEIDK